MLDSKLQRMTIKSSKFSKILTKDILVNARGVVKNETQSILPVSFAVL